MALLPLLALVFGAAYLWGRHAEHAGHASPAHVGAPVRAAPALRAPLPPRAYAPPPPRYDDRGGWDRDHRPDRRFDRPHYRGERPVIDVEVLPACPPSPMAVLAQILATGQAPSPFVVQCAIAEAELTGRYDVAYGLTQQYVLPALQGGPGPVPDPGPGPGPDSSASAADGAAPDDEDQAGTGSGTGSGSGAPAPEVPSPISGVADRAWSALLGRLVRESPTFATAKHVGRYRHHKARAAEIGFDPTILAGDPGLQDLAMSTDLADSFRHLSASGTLDHAVGAEVTLPGQDGSVRATLSGVLGVCSVAGLEGAIGWLENPAERAKYPHTTMAFIKTNGAF